MKIISTHSHLLTNPSDLDNLVEHGLFSSIWLLQLPYSMNISAEYTHPATEEELLMIAKRYPGQLLPFKWVDYRQGPEQVDRAVEKGFVGFKGFCPPHPYDDDSYLPIYERMNQYRTCMVFHTGYVTTPSYARRSPDLGYQAANMHPAALRELSMFFPETIFVAAHFGFPWENELLDNEVRMGCPNLYIDLSGGQWQKMTRMLEENAMLPAALEGGRIGTLADRLIFGVDAYFGHPQLHRDITEYCGTLLQYFESKRTENVLWSDSIEGILYKNAKQLQKRNALICQ